jgi:nucleobase:cation symporter-1, NCS1 family
MTIDRTSARVSHSDRLYNEDLAPSTPAGRTWGIFSLTSVWFADMHNIGQYTMAAGLIFLGISPLQVLIGCLLGFLVCYLAVLALGFAGQRYGVPFPVVARASFGVFGSNLPALIRAAVAVAWYSIQTYLASLAIIVLLEMVWPSSAQLNRHNFLGLSYLGWICFVLLWAAQLLVISHGLETVRRFQNWAGATIMLLMVLIAVVLLVEAHGHIDLTGTSGPTLGTGAHVNTFFSTGGIWVSTFSTLILNFSDFTRFTPSKRALVWGGFWGLPVNGTFFIAIVVTATLASKVVYGKALTDPTQMLVQTHNDVIVVVGAVVFILATVGVNVIANLISPAYDLANVFPKRITFKRGAYISCFVALVVFPWKIYASTVTLDYFLGGMGAMLGPIFGIMIADYYLVKRQHLDVDQLYSDSPDGPYFYRKGWNLRAIAAFIPAAIVSIAIDVVPAFHAGSAYSWFVSVALAGGTYTILAPARRPSESFDPSEPAPTRP